MTAPEEMAGSNGQRCAVCGRDVVVYERDFDPQAWMGGPRIWLHFGCEEDYYRDAPEVAR